MSVQSALIAASVILAASPMMVFAVAPVSLRVLATRELAWYMESWCWCSFARSLLPKDMVEKLANDVQARAGVGDVGGDAPDRRRTVSICYYASAALALLVALGLSYANATLAATAFNVADGLLIGLVLVLVDVLYTTWAVTNGCHVASTDYTRAFLEGVRDGLKAP